MNNHDELQKVIRSYQKRSEDIVLKMYKIIERAQRKIDDIEYRKILEKIQP